MAVALGALPAIVAFYFRITMNETESFAAEQSEPTLSTSQAVSQNSMLLLGTAGAWFILDVTFYGNSLFSGDVTQAIGAADSPKDQAIANFYINLLAMPGYILSI